MQLFIQRFGVVGLGQKGFEMNAHLPEQLLAPGALRGEVNKSRHGRTPGVVV
jgi:hypothetical protein